MFSCYYVARPCDLDLWPFDLESVSCTVLLMSDPHTYFYYIRLSVTELRVLNIWSHFRYLKQSLRMRRHLTLTGGKNSSHFWNTWPQIAYSFCHFQGARTKMKPCYRRKIAFSHYEGYKVYCACAVSRNLFIGGPPKPHVTMFSPRLIYSLYNFYWATMTIRGSLYWSIPMLKLFSVAKNEVPSNIGPRNGGFFKFKGPNIKYSHRDPKRHLLARNDVIWRILRKYPSRCVGCSLIEEPKKTNKKLVTQKHRKITYLGNINPWTDRYKILHAGCRPWRNHACQFCEDRLRGFGVARGRILAIFIYLLSSPLKHSHYRASVWCSFFWVLQ